MVVIEVIVEYTVDGLAAVANERVGKILVFDTFSVHTILRHATPRNPNERLLSRKHEFHIPTFQSFMFDTAATNSLAVSLDYAKLDD